MVPLLVALLLVEGQHRVVACNACDRSHWTDHRRVKSKRFSCSTQAAGLVPGAEVGKGGCMCQGDKCDDAAACCTACQKYADDGTFGGCDAWFMNGHDCFFKLCTDKEWEDGDCAILWSTEAEKNEKYGSGIMTCAMAWGWQLNIILMGTLGLYVGGGVAVGKQQGRDSGGGGRSKLGPVSSHPHASRWFELWSLVADGLAFTLARARGRGTAAVNARAPLLGRSRGDKSSKSSKKKSEKKQSTEGGSTSMTSGEAPAGRRTRSPTPTPSPGRGASALAPIITTASVAATAAGTTSMGGGRWVRVPTSATT
eukprot:COSAG02_NODE_781_length_17261_cov_433.056054_14_plen_311_part_00